MAAADHIPDSPGPSESRSQYVDRRQRYDPPSWTPVPDPTALTTEALQREVGALREIIEAQVMSLTGKLNLQIEELKVAASEMRRYFDAMLSERDARYSERFKASQLAIDAAFEANKEAVEAAFEAREKAIAAAFESSEKAVRAAFDSADRAIQKAEVSIEKRADATYVALGELQRLLGGLMPRQEAEARYANQEERLATVSVRMERLEAAKAGKTEILPWILAAAAVIGLLLTIYR